MKFVFSQCHVNKYNIFNQVAIQSIKCYGTLITQSKRNSMPVSNEDYSDSSQLRSYMANVGLKENLNAKDSNNDNSFIGHFFQDKLKSLKKQEEKAIYEDDYENLKKIRTMIKSILKSCKKLTMLAAKKSEAIANEDYETAQMIKFEINKIQKSIMANNERNNTSKLSKGRGATLSPIEYRSKPASRKVLNNSIAHDMNVQDSYGVSNSKSTKMLNPLSSNTVRKKESLPTLDNDIFAPKGLPRADERELPALGRNTPIDYNKVNEDEFEHQKPDKTESTNITLKVEKRYVQLLDKLTNILGDEMAKKACADKWYFQQEAITNSVGDLTSILSGKSDSD